MASGRQEEGDQKRSSRWSAQASRTNVRRTRKKEEEMNPSPQVAALWQHIKKRGHVLLFISVLTLLALIAGGGSLLSSASAPLAGQMAASDGDIRIGSSSHTLSSQVGSQIATTNGDIHVGG